MWAWGRRFNRRFNVQRELELSGIEGRDLIRRVSGDVSAAGATGPRGVQPGAARPKPSPRRLASPATDFRTLKKKALQLRDDVATADAVPALEVRNPPPLPPPSQALPSAAYTQADRSVAEAAALVAATLGPKARTVATQTAGLGTMTALLDANGTQEEAVRLCRQRGWQAIRLSAYTYDLGILTQALLFARVTAQT